MHRLSSESERKVELLIQDMQETLVFFSQDELMKFQADWGRRSQTSWRIGSTGGVEGGAGRTAVQEAESWSLVQARALCRLDRVDTEFALSSQRNLADAYSETFADFEAAAAAGVGAG